MLRALVVMSLFVGGSAHAADKCELATPLECLQRGLQLLEASPPDPAGAVPWVAKACESKYGDGCAQLGFMHMQAIGVAPDDTKAFALSKKGCDLGSGLGCMNAAVLTRDGRGTKKSFTGAVALFEKSCGNDHDEACAIVAAAYLNGEDTLKPDIKKAVWAFEKRCKLGHGDICNSLGISVLNGEHGIKADRKKALEHFAAGCKLGDQDACDNQKIAASETAGAASGKVSAVLGARSGKKLNIKVTGAAPPVGATGDVSKQVEQAGFSMWLVIGTAKVVKVNGQAVELEVLEEKSEVVIDGKKVNHWTAGSALTFEWK